MLLFGSGLDTSGASSLWSVPPPPLTPSDSSSLHLNPGGPWVFGVETQGGLFFCFQFLLKTKLQKDFDVLHPGQPPQRGPDHEGGAALHRHDPGPLLDAGRRDFGREHGGPEVKTLHRRTRACGAPQVRAARPSRPCC